jgi:tetratricopeptide (TPR) repeat protein
MPKANPLTRVERLGLFHPAGFIVLACIGAYWNSLGGALVWNDQASIVDNQTIRHLWPLGALLAPPSASLMTSRPVVNLSFALNYAIGEVDVVGYHIVNIAIHLISALVLFGIIRRTLGSEKGPYPFSASDEKGVRPLFGNDVLALGAALLWLVHPLQSEAVNYVSGRSDLLMGLFFFLTIFCAADARGSLHPTHQVLWESASVVCCALGMASSELMLTAPLVVLAYDRVFEFDSFREALRTRRTLYVALAATWLELAWLLWSTGRPSVALLPSVGFWTQVLNQFQITAHYLWLAVWPGALVLDYGPPLTLSLRQVWPAAILTLALVTATAVALQRWLRVGFLGAAFLLTLAPGAILGPILGDVGAERRMYVPLAALVIQVVISAAWLTDWLAGRLPAHSKLIANVTLDLVFVILLAFAVRTVYRNEQYADPVALWTRTVAERPHGRARYALATSLIAAGAEDEGIQQLRQVSDVAASRYTLGNELYAVGNMVEAAQVLQQLLRDHPAGADLLATRLLLARTRMAQGKLEESAAEFQAILDVNPDEAARQGLAELGTAQRIIAADLLRREHVDEAVAHAREAVRLRPTEADAHATLGSALAAQGQPDEAIVQFREALRIDPGEQEAQSGLVAALNQPRTGRRP